MDDAAKVTKLEQELYTAQQTILNLMPKRIYRELNKYLLCDTDEDAIAWEIELINKIISYSEPRNAEDVGEAGSSIRRSYCPLCRDSAHKPWGAEGFAYPEGLKRHLEGSNNARTCPVMKAAKSLCELRIKNIQT